ncbi:hypothetical protein BDR07DRAFT_1412112 [Suillus spraguei]|nr:hypothetical protein BDR07DRAFT_1414312 [Suillus spraguei]KAG2360616.1 hypothetical protein BDR07DRAFT_1412112 [Suillus spraguei]
MADDASSERPVTILSFSTLVVLLEVSPGADDTINHTNTTAMLINNFNSLKMATTKNPTAGVEERNDYGRR